MTSRWRSQYWFSEAASDFHESVRQIFINEMPFKNLRCYQEVNVRELIPDYQYANHHFDWYIEQLGVVLELHGAQHYKPINYGNKGIEDLQVDFRRMKFRDNAKATAAVENGFTYVSIPYTEKHLCSEVIIQYIEKGKTQ